MKHIHVAVVCHPMPPHVGPTLPVVSTLVRRGYRVTYATSSPFSSRVSEVGAEVIQIPTFVPFTKIEPQYKERFQHPICRAALKTLSIITTSYEYDRPNLILYDLDAFAGRILANRWNIPAIQTAPTFALRKDTFDAQIKNQKWRAELLELSEHADRFLTHYGAKSSDFLFHRERLNIYFVPKTIQPEGDVFGDNCFHAGRCAGEQLYYGSWHKKNVDGRPVALVSTSTAYLRGPEFFRLCLDALIALNCYVILSTGEGFDIDSLGPLPPTCEVIQGTAHVMIMPHVSLFVCLGGNISAAEAAYFGVPMIVTSHGFPELEYQGDNIADVGLGVHLRERDLDVSSLRESAARLLKDATIHRRVREIQRAVRREPGGEETANIIEDYIEAYCSKETGSNGARSTA